MIIEIVREADKFKDLKDEWNNLLFKSKSPSIFLTWEWLFYWWKYFKDDNTRLYILLVRDENSSQILGIAPLCIQKDKRFGFKRIRFLGTEKVASDFLGFIINPNYESKIVTAILNYLYCQRNAWDLIEISDLEENSGLKRLIYENNNTGRKIVEIDAQLCPYIPLPQNYSRLYESFNPDLQNILKRRLKKFQKNYEVSFSTHTDHSEIKNKIDELFLLHNSRSNMKKRASGFESSFKGRDIQAFHREVASDFLSNGWLRLYSLNCNQKAVASLYAFKYIDSMSYYQSGFDDSYQNFSPGSILMEHCLQDAIKDGLKEFHYLRGNEEYKLKWTKDAKKTKTILIINRTLNGNIFDAYLRVKTAVKNSFKNA